MSLTKSKAIEDFKQYIKPTIEIICEDYNSELRIAWNNFVAEMWASGAISSCEMNMWTGLSEKYLK